MPKLYEIMQGFDTLASMDMETDEDVTAFLALLAEQKETFDVKAENYCKLIRNLESDAEAFKAEKLRLEKRQKSIENKVAYIRKYLQTACEQIMSTGETRKIGTFTLRLKQNPERVELTRETFAPGYMRVEPDKARIKEALKAGATIPGAALVRDTSLQIS